MTRGLFLLLLSLACVAGRAAEADLPPKDAVLDRLTHSRRRFAEVAVRWRSDEVIICGSTTSELPVIGPQRIGQTDPPRDLRIHADGVYTKKGDREAFEAVRDMWNSSTATLAPKGAAIKQTETENGFRQWTFVAGDKKPATRVSATDHLVNSQPETEILDRAIGLHWLRNETFPMAPLRRDGDDLILGTPFNPDRPDAARTEITLDKEDRVTRISTQYPNQPPAIVTEIAYGADGRFPMGAVVRRFDLQTGKVLASIVTLAFTYEEAPGEIRDLEF